MKKNILFMLMIMVILWGVNSYGSTINLSLLNPTSLVRGTGSPTIKTYSFNSSFGGPATVRVSNGSLEDSTEERVSSSVIKLNSQILFSPSQFNQNVYQIEKEVLLARGNNTIEVELRGKPGGRITFQVFQKVSNVRVIPESIVFDTPGTSAQIRVLGTLTDGTEINITGSSYGTSYSSSSVGIAMVTTEGLVSAVTFGRAVITVVNGPFTAGVPVFVKGSHPSVFNISLAPKSLPVPREGDQFIQRLAFDFADPNGDIDRLDITLIYPDGATRNSSHQFPEAVPGGTYLDSFSVDSSFKAGTYLIDIEAIDRQGNRSGVNTESFTLSEATERLVEITEISPGEGAPGDVVAIIGRGFITESPLENRIQFQKLARADIVAVTPDQVKVVVPVGALSGPIVLETPTGRMQSLMEFKVNPRMAILPVITRLLTGKTVDFTIAQSGMRSAAISCSINGQTVPDPSLGTLELSLSGFTYTSPPNVPVDNPVLIRCITEDAPGVYAEMGIEITTTIPSPGTAYISSVHGGIIESVQGDVRISIPPGSLTSDTSITVEQLDPDDLGFVVDNAYPHAVVRLEPSGVEFSNPVAITLPLRNWEEPGSFIPLYIINESTGAFEDTGNTAVVDESGLRVIGSINHFSVYAVMQPYSPSQVAARQAVTQLVQGNPSILTEFGMRLSPDMPLLEGLSVPVLVSRREGPLDGIGPFAAPSLLNVSVEIEGYTSGRPAASDGPLVQPSPEGWELGTVINIGTLPDCDEGSTKQGYLNIDYEKAGLQENISIPFTIQCLDELIFSGSTPPSFVPSDMLPLGGVRYYEYKGLRVRQDQHGLYSVELMYPGQTYRFSKVDIGTDGVLTYTPSLSLDPIGVEEPYIMEVTGDVRIAGIIRLSGAMGWYGNDGGGPPCGDCGGSGGRGSFLNAGDGGHGGEFSGPCDANCCAALRRAYCPISGVPCLYSCPQNVTFRSGQYGQDGFGRPYSGGQGGIVWEKGDFLNFATSLVSFISSAGSCVASGGAVCIIALYDLYKFYGSTAAIIGNDDDYIVVPEKVDI